MTTRLKQAAGAADGAAVSGEAQLARRVRELEHELLGARERMAQIMRHIPDVLFGLSLPDFHPTFVSDSVTPLLGFEPRELIEQPDLWRQQVHHADRERVLAELAEVVRLGTAGPIEARFWHRDGATLRWFEGRMALERDPDGRPRSLLGVMTDITARKRADADLARHRHNLAELVAERTKALRQRERMLGLFVRHSPAAVAMFDRSMRYLLVSERWRRDYGLGEQELVGRSHYEVFPEIPERWKEIHRDCLGGTAQACEEDVFPRVGGGEDWVRWEVHPWYAESGEVGGLLLLTEVITDRRAAGQALRRSQASLAEAQRLAHLGNWEWDLLSGAVFWSDEVYRIFGRSPERFRPTLKRFLEAVHPQDRKAVRRAGEAIFETGRAGEKEYRIVRPDGRECVVHGRAEIIFDAQGRPVRMVGTVQDITKRKRAEEELRAYRRHLEELVRERTERLRQEVDERRGTEQALRQSEQMLRLVTEALPAQVAYVDDQERLLFSNRAHRQWWGLSARALHGRPLREILGNAGYALVEPHLRRALAGETANFELSLSGPDGQPAHLSVSYIPDLAENGSVRGVVGLVHDISERLRAAELARLHMVEVAHVSRLSTMGGMATELAHELNQPLTAIAGYGDACARLLAREDTPREEVARVLEAISDQAHRAGEIIRRLRSFVSKQETRLQRLDVNELVRETLRFAEVETRWRGVRLKVSLAGPLPAVSADRILIEQVILNLVRNAIEAMAGLPDVRRTLLIETGSAPRGGVQVSVRDAGPGLTPEQCEQVFEAFFTTKRDGMGMGLSISRSIVEMHGGSLRVEGNEAGGSTFSFDLPLADRETGVKAHV